MRYIISLKVRGSYQCVVLVSSDAQEPIGLLNHIEAHTKDNPAWLSTDLSAPHELPLYLGAVEGTTVQFPSKGDVLRFASANADCSVFVHDNDGSYTVSFYSQDIPIGGFFVDASTNLPSEDAPTDGEEPNDILVELFRLQANMNDTAFTKQSIHSVASGEPMRTEFFFRNLIDTNKPINANSDTCVWLRNYIWAAQAELGELAELVPQKWWSKNQLNLEAAREEFIDVLHFMLSIGLSLGLDAKGVQDVYRKKNAVNLQRQAAGYIARGNG